MTEPETTDKAKSLPVGCAIFAVVLTIVLMLGAAMVVRAANTNPAPVQPGSSPSSST